MTKRPNTRTDVFKHINMHNMDASVCWEWKRDVKGGGRDNRPYFDVSGKKYLAYRIVYELFTGKKLDDTVILRHKCDNQHCCNPHHLEEGTHIENMRDMRERERHGLPHHTVRAIRKLYNEGRTQEEIAKLYGISRENVSAIVTRRTYSDI